MIEINRKFVNEKSEIIRIKKIYPVFLPFRGEGELAKNLSEDGGGGFSARSDFLNGYDI